MPRPVRIRVSYTNDALFLTRLIEAVEHDTRDSEFQSAVIPPLQQAAQLLLVGPKEMRRKAKR